MYQPTSVSIYHAPPPFVSPSTWEQYPLWEPLHPQPSGCKRGICTTTQPYGVKGFGISHGDPISPLRIGLWRPLPKWPKCMAYKMGVILTAYESWDDPPNRVSYPRFLDLQDLLEVLGKNSRLK